MNKMISILIVLAIVGLVAYLILKIPTVSMIITCYDQNTQTFDDAEYGSRAQGYSQLRLCQLKGQSIDTLNQCVSDAQVNDHLPGKVYENIIGLLITLHPGIKDINQMKIEHNAECKSYPSTLFNL
jgi:hypothetical protein